MYSTWRMCRVLQEHEYTICPATYYRYLKRGFGPTDAELDQAYAANRLFDLWVANRCVYGRRKLWKAARRSGWNIGRDQVDTLMKVLGIKGVLRKKTTRTTIPDPTSSRFADHIQRAWKEATRPNQWWVADFTYVATECGFSYVSFVEDVYTREFLGFVVDDHPDRSLVIRALRQAVATRRRQDPFFTTAGVIHHSDAGSQYTSRDLRKLLEEYEMEGSIGTVGDAYDNGLMESAIGLYKTEVIDFGDTRWRDSAHVEAVTAEWFWWYNHHRLHSSIGDIPPAEKYTNYSQQSAPVAA
ncbi:IS3 family transposase [Corynebacterium cystitidis]|uniref:IS3 family transposase n=1 Tax=Corynebacterium cystitidis TaxID=35757 RepID=UPI00211E63B0|nr:IS3 family transposase [Corynebacterium cystitidis]